MPQLGHEQFLQYLSLGHEVRSVEFKGPGPRSGILLAKVVRAVIGMANLRDGGVVIVGVDESSGNLVPTGIEAADLATWRYDDIAAKVSEYADPSVMFELEVLEVDGKSFVVLHVEEFDDVPVICRKDLQQPGERKPILRDGACYVRSRKKPETSEIPSHNEMRELLDLATEKRLRSLIARASSGGMIVPGPSTPSAEELYRSELGDLSIS